MSLSGGRIRPNQPTQLGPPLPVPYHELGFLSSHSISHSLHVAATPLECLEKLIDTNTWIAWNPLTPRAVLTATPSITDETTNAPELRELITRPGCLYRGVRFTADVHMFLDPAKRTNTADEECLAVERFETEDGRKGYRVVWRYIGMPWSLTHGERVHEFIESKEGHDTEYIGWETFGGIISFFMKYAMSGVMVHGFEKWNDGFRIFLEHVGRGERTY